MAFRDRAHDRMRDLMREHTVQLRLVVERTPHRHADDAVVGFEVKEEAEQFVLDAAARLAQYGLMLHPEKTKLLPFGTQVAKRGHHAKERGSSFDFLGFSHYMGRTRKGWFTVMRKTKRSRLVGQLKQIRRELKGKRLHRPVGETGAWLRSVV